MVDLPSHCKIWLCLLSQGRSLSQEQLFTFQMCVAFQLPSSTANMAFGLENSQTSGGPGSEEATHVWLQIQLCDSIPVCVGASPHMAKSSTFCPLSHVSALPVRSLGKQPLPSSCWECQGNINFLGSPVSKGMPTPGPLQEPMPS